jgi:dethiobiotin synthetase
MQPLFITGIGTDVGKTLVSSILAEALHAGYWKPVQAGYAHGTDSQWVSERITNPQGRVHPELYRLSMAVSPHIAAREEGLRVDLDEIVSAYRELAARRLEPGARSLQPGARRLQLAAPIIIEGAGGLLVPLNDSEFVIDLAAKLDATLVLVSRNYLGSINHSLLTAAACNARGLRVAGWIFNDQYLDYEEEIVRWTGIPAIASIPKTDRPDAAFIREQGERIRPLLQINPYLCGGMIEY